MASSSGYILFSQTSLPFGTRDLWGPAGLPGGMAGVVAGLVNGTITDVPLSAFDAFQGTEVVRADWALFDLIPGGQTAPDAALTGAIDAAAVTGDGRVFAAPPGPRNPAVACDGDPSGGVSIVLADRDWNGIKNVEVLLTNADLGEPSPHVFIRNVVDVRVKLADSVVTEEGPPRSATIVIENAKRGEIDGSALGQLDATLSFASNGPGWGNGFAITGALGTSNIRLLPGDWAGGPTTLDGFRGLVNDGSLTRVVVTMAGDSAFDARAVAAMTDVRAGADAGALSLQWDGLGYETAAAGNALAVTFGAPAAHVALGLLLALPGPMPTLGPVALWRDGALIETVSPAFVETVLDVDPGTGEQRLLVAVDWLASRSFDTMTIDGLGGIGAPLAAFGGAARPRSIVLADTPPDTVRGTDGSGSLLVAGPGVNVFRYAHGDNVDTIWNFAKGQDVLVLESADARVFETAGGTVVMFATVDIGPSGRDVIIDERNGITLVGAPGLVIGTDIIFA